MSCQYHFDVEIHKYWVEKEGEFTLDGGGGGGREEVRARVRESGKERGERVREGERGWRERKSNWRERERERERERDGEGGVMISNLL